MAIYIYIKGLFPILIIWVSKVSYLQVCWKCRIRDNLTRILEVQRSWNRKVRCAANRLQAATKSGQTHQIIIIQGLHHLYHLISFVLFYIWNTNISIRILESQSLRFPSSSISLRFQLATSEFNVLLQGDLWELAVLPPATCLQTCSMLSVDSKKKGTKAIQPQLWKKVWILAHINHHSVYIESMDQVKI